MSDHDRRESFDSCEFPYMNEAVTTDSRRKSDLTVDASEAPPGAWPRRSPA